MSQWNLYGYKLTDEGFSQLNPTRLKEDLEKYRKTLGKEFTLDELLKIYDIESKLCIATACGQAPEWFFHELGQGNFASRMEASVQDGLGEVAEAINDVADNLSNLQFNFEDMKK